MEDPCKPQAQTRTRSQVAMPWASLRSLRSGKYLSHDVSPFKLSKIMFKGAL